MRVLLAAVLVAAAPALCVLPAAAEEEPTGYQRVVDLTFPVSGPASYVDSYDDDRGGGTRKHQATDVMADKLQHVHAAVAGEICYLTGVDGTVPGYGYMIELCGDDGLVYSYVHLNNDSPGTDDGAGGVEWAYAPGIREGVAVQRGQWIAYAGDSGNAEGGHAHLHFSIADPDLDDPRIQVDPYLPDRINPFNSLEAARERGDVPEPPDDAPASEPERAPAEEPSDESGDESESGAQRLSGADRVRTAIALSRSRGAGAATVIVAPAGDHAEALVAAPLAGFLDAPVLLSGPDGLDEPVAAEVTRLGARNAYVLGTSAQLSSATESQLRAAGVANVARLEAADVFALSALVARELGSYPQVAAFDRVLLAVGAADDPSRAWPDALSATALAAHLEVPILLVGGDGLPQPVADLLSDLAPGRVTVVGGTSAVPAAVAEAAADAAGATLERLAGATRYGTSVAVAREAVDEGLVADAVWVATGRSFPDALAAGPAAARAGATLLLVDGEAVGGAPESEDWLAGEADRLDSVVVVGGTRAVSDAVAREVARLLAG